MCEHDVPDGNRPAPQADHSMWSTVQAAITGGWSTTIRFIAIVTVAAASVALLGAWAGTPISAVMGLFL
ncbi:hypothetical protein ACQEVC_34195 [Plantactinospora sp. CA-294935]|uniref:hypothetical protein n=1 Tax=Plantactinospora sp. CA-294935 TaxID=3240012 RepID=UPI003D8AAEA1